MTMAHPAGNDPGIFELRIYEAMADRIGALHKRMGEDVLPVFARHGVPRPVANWECRLGPAAPLYIYLLRWPDMDERMAAFQRFYADPQWHAMYAQGPTINAMDVCFMRPSLAWPDAESDRNPGPVHELRFYNFTTADSEAGQRLLRDVEIPHQRANGGVLLGSFSVVLGADTPRAVTIVAWNSFDERRLAWEAFESDEIQRRARASGYYRNGRPIIGSTSVYLMRPAPYGLPVPGFGEGRE